MNKKLFGTGRAPRAGAVNDAGGKAYDIPPKHALAQLAVTGTFGGTYYAQPEAELDAIKALVLGAVPSRHKTASASEQKHDSGGVTAEFVAKTAVYARRRGYMKDVPAVLLACLAEMRSPWLERAFPRVIDNGKMLRNFVEAVRSEAVGRKTFGQGARRALRGWFACRDAPSIFRASVGNPPLSDVLRMVHPKPETKAKDALYAYLLGSSNKSRDLPDLVKHFEAWKNILSAKTPDVPFRMLTGVEDLPESGWTSIALAGKWHQTRMNLNTYARHGVFDTDRVVEKIAAKLRDPEAVRKARAFPYQLLVAYRNVDASVPHPVKEALQDAMEVATENAPDIPGAVVVAPDVSGSMSAPVTGHRGSATTTVRCTDVAALFASCVIRRNPRADVMPFNTEVVDVRVNPRDTVMTNAGRLARVGGGTACSAPLARLNRAGVKVDAVVVVSDSESWADIQAQGVRRYGMFGGFRGAQGTMMMEEWLKLKKRCPKARLVCIDLTPTTSAQVKDMDDVLLVGGFSDAVFDIVNLFLRDELTAAHWVGEIEKTEV